MRFARRHGGRAARYRTVLSGLTAAAVALAVVASGSPVAAAPAEGSIRDAGGDGVVPGSYIVVLKPTAAATGPSARSLGTRYGGAVTHTYTRAVRGFAARLSEEGARRLAADPAVEYVQRNGVHRVSGVQAGPPSWGLDRIDQRGLPLDGSFSYPSGAAAVHAYVIDTGIRTTHADFGGRAGHGRDTIDNDDDATDCHGHGTHVAGTLGGSTYGVAKQVRLVAVRVLDCAGDGTTASVVAGVDWVTANAVRPAVVNMSLGGSVDSILDSAVSASIASGLTYTLAAGNGNIRGVPLDACTQSPSRVISGITVGATQSTDARASWSNTGTCLDLFAPGVSITSAWYTADWATSTISGTSMAAPHVAGAAALILATNRGYTPLQVRNQLITRASPGRVTDPRSGSPNLMLYVGSPAPGRCIPNEAGTGCVQRPRPIVKPAGRARQPVAQ